MFVDFFVLILDLNSISSHFDSINTPQLHWEDAPTELYLDINIFSDSVSAYKDVDIHLILTFSKKFIL